MPRAIVVGVSSGIGASISLERLESRYRFTRLIRRRPERMCWAELMTRSCLLRQMRGGAKRTYAAHRTRQNAPHHAFDGPDRERVRFVLGIQDRLLCVRFSCFRENTGVAAETPPSRLWERVLLSLWRTLCHLGAIVHRHICHYGSAKLHPTSCPM